MSNSDILRNRVQQVNLFLPAGCDSEQNGPSPKYHIHDIYERVFSSVDFSVTTVDRAHSIVAEAAANYFRIGSGTLNIVTQGYSVLAAYAAQKTKRAIRVLVHTWKVPGISEFSLSSKLYGKYLGALIGRSVLTTVSSRKQERQLADLFPEVPVCFAPVTVDSNYWMARAHQNGILAKYSLEDENYILTVGGSDRLEEIGILVCELLDMKYVRVTRNPEIASLVRRTESNLGIKDRTLLLQGVSDTDLASLYNHALVVLLPTVTETNPAGLSALVEAMSCGGVVAAPKDLAEGYLSDNLTGFVLENLDVNYVAERISESANQREMISVNARFNAVNSLNAERASTVIRNRLGELGEI